MKNKKVIFLVDMQSFYASVEIASNHNLQGKPVVVCGDPEKRHGIALAASPEAKKAGVKTGMPAWEVRNLCPDAQFVRPHMKKYIDASIQITEILRQFTDKVEVFSIDEQFLDVTASYLLFGTPDRMAQNIQEKIWEEVGVKARVGIGDNKIQAKMACDRFAKKNNDGIFRLSFETYKEITQSLPIDDLFGVGSRMKRNMERIGIFTIGQLAERSLEELKKHWGIMGHVLWLSSQGIDYSPVESQSTVEQKGIGNSITLPRDYHLREEIEVVLLEITEEVGRRARKMNLHGKTVHLSLRGTDFNLPTGFHRQVTLPYPTNDTLEIYHTVLLLLDQFWDKEPIRRVGISLTQLQDDRVVQLSLFSNSIKKRELAKTMDQIRDRFGRTAVFRASSLLSTGLLFDRATKIGGHEA